MKNEIIELTKTEPNCAIKFGQIENTKLAQEIIDTVKEKLGIEIMLCYLADENLECHLRNPKRCKVEEIIFDKIEFIGIINTVLAHNNFKPIEIKSIRFVDFDIQAVSLLLINSVTAIKKFISKEFNTDVNVFYPKVNENEKIVNHHLVIYSQKAMDSIVDSDGINKIKERFSKYLSEKDFWKVFDNFEYAPVLILSSDLDERQQFDLGFYGF